MARSRRLLQWLDEREWGWLFPLASVSRNGGVNSISAAEMAVVRRFLQPMAGSFFLFGPRGTGKSTAGTGGASRLSGPAGTAAGAHRRPPRRHLVRL